jgi:hypothetical protein
MLITPLVGNHYVLNHSSGLIRARFLKELVCNPVFNSNRLHSARRSTTHYLFENDATKREIIIKSRVKIRRLVEDGK